ncbi:MAG TPA: DUF4403 family protein [Cyclobacteriaceae bacterium]|nr:DUF4403 family protein [Cyclobacteriaceae bacterium]
MKFQSLIVLFVFFTVASCKSIDPNRSFSSGDTVSVPKAHSSINVPLEIPLSYLETQLNQGLKDLLYAEKGLPVGNDFLADIQIFRTGKIGLSAQGTNSLKIKLPLRLEGNLDFQKKLFGQMISTSIPYNESLAPEISFSPEIGEDWEVNLNNIRIESWGRSMKYQLLGYEVDLDPIVRPRIEKILNSQLNAGGASGISLKNLINNTWEAFAKPLKIERGAVDLFIYTIPQQIKINNQITSDQKLKLNIGLEGEVVTQVGEKPDIRPGPPPALGPSNDTINQIDLTLPLTVSYKSIDQFLTQELVDKPIKLKNNNLLIPNQINTQSYGEKALVKVEFTLKRGAKKDLKGELNLVGRPAYDRESMSIVFEDVDFDISTKNILASISIWFKRGQIRDGIKKHAVYPIEDYVAGARAELQNLGGISTGLGTFQVVNPQLDVQGIYVTPEDIQIFLQATGKVDSSL